MDTRSVLPDTTSSSSLRIGQVAAASGLTVETIRYYEQLGLLPRPPRTAGRVRRYSDDVLSRLTLIGQAKALGLALADIRELVGTNRPKGVPCREVHETLTVQIAALDAKVAALKQLRKTLVNYQLACAQALRANPEPNCPTLRTLSKEGPSPREAKR